MHININDLYSRTNTLEVELTKCQSEIISLEKELSEALHNNLMELSNRSSGNHIITIELFITLFNSNCLQYSEFNLIY